MGLVIGVGIFCFLFPFLAKWLSAVLGGKISPIVICYAVGILLANLSGIAFPKEVLTKITEISILLAIPLLLATANPKDWIRYAPGNLFAYLLGGASAALVSVLAAYFLFPATPHIADAGGMLTAIFMGGTPNLQAVGLAMQSPQSVIITTNSAEIFWGTVHFLMLITFIPALLQTFMRPFKAKTTDELLPQTYFHENDVSGNEQPAPSSGSVSFLNVGLFKQLIFSLGLGIGLVGLTLGLCYSVYGNLKNSIFIFIVLTILGVLVSLIPRIQRMPSNEKVADYFLLVFSISLGLSADFREIFQNSGDIVIYTGIVLFGSFILHILFCWVFKIDRDTMLITSTAGIYSPAFVGQMASVLRNPTLVAPGIAMGLLGYCIGNFSGMGIVLLLRYLLP